MLVKTTITISKELDIRLREDLLNFRKEGKTVSRDDYLEKILWRGLNHNEADNIKQ